MLCFGLFFSFSFSHCHWGRCNEMNVISIFLTRQNIFSILYFIFFCEIFKLLNLLSIFVSKSFLFSCRCRCVSDSLNNFVLFFFFCFFLFFFTNLLIRYFNGVISKKFLSNPHGITQAMYSSSLFHFIMLCIRRNVSQVHKKKNAEKIIAKGNKLNKIRAHRKRQQEQKKLNRKTFTVKLHYHAKMSMSISFRLIFA